jgi:hypothetical protein
MMLWVKSLRLRKEQIVNFRVFSFIISLVIFTAVQAEQAPSKSFQETLAQRAAEASKAREDSRFSAMRRDFFSRFNRDPDARAGEGEIEVDGTWKVVLADDADPLAELMSGHFVDFMQRRMGVSLKTQRRPRADLADRVEHAIVLLGAGGGDPAVAESYTLTVTPGEIRLAGLDPEGLRDGIVKLIDLIGFREAPILAVGQQVYRPQIPLRFGAHGSPRDNVLMGYNALVVPANLFAVSNSQAIPELADRQRPGTLQAALQTAKEARRYGMITYINLESSRGLTRDDPVFKAHPDIRGALTLFGTVLCTQHPLVKRYLSETVEGILRADPQLGGVFFIVGGEGFYHCFTRPKGVANGHTNCPRCEALGAETVVANLCNYIAQAARRVNPNAQVIAWLYSAQVWSADPAQVGFIQLLKPGTAIITDVVKGEWMVKPNGLKKKLWDYSIDLIGPSQRVRQQIQACRLAGIPIYLLTMCEDTVEYPDLPHIPCLDRWVDRGEVMAACGASGVMGGHFGAYDASSASEVYKHLWWDPAPDKEAFLQRFAARLAGAKAGPHLRKAWKYASDAFDFSPQIGNYYLGPHYLGPAHPMCADPEAQLPEAFYGSIRGRPRHPIFITSPTLTGASGSMPAIIGSYRRMKQLLELAVAEMDIAGPLVPERNRLMFDAEDISIRWFYHTVRTEMNFYESCYLRDRLLKLAAQVRTTDPRLAEARQIYDRWRQVLLDEQANTTEALPLMEADARLDFYKRKDHVIFPPGGDMLRAKLQVIDHEINEYLPGLARRLGLED